MGSFKATLITSVLAYGLIAGAIVGAILFYTFPAFYTNWYLAILAFFLVAEPLILLFVEHESKGADANPKKLLNAYMMTKVIKTIAMLASIGIYAIAVKENLKSFALTFFILYIIFLAIETFLFTRIEKRLKEKKQ